MTSLLEPGLLFAILFLSLKPAGVYIARVYSQQFIFIEPLLLPIEKGFYKLLQLDTQKEMLWQEYATHVLSAGFIGFLCLFLLLKWQGYLPLNPSHYGNLSDDLAFNIAISFLTNTNWQSYSGELTLSYFSQMFGLTVQNFLSASMGMAVGVALIRGFVRKNTPFIGNFWVDWTRGILYILLPLSIIFSLFLISQGVIQNFNDPTTVSAYGDANSPIRYSIPGGPVASQVAIKMLGSNGGGFFNTSAAHPFENPTELSNFIETFSIFFLPASFFYAFGVMINKKKQGWMLLFAITILCIPLFRWCYLQEKNYTLSVFENNIDFSSGNMEGKEVRLGVLRSTLWACAATATANGSVNSMLDSFTAIGGMFPLILMLFGEILFGGVGSGLYGMLVFMLITVFICGLMIGHTPEFLGKKIQFFEIKMALLVILIPMFFLLFGLLIVCTTSAGLTAQWNVGPHGFTELLYTLTSTAMNNGSAFAGVNTNTPFYNTLLGSMMLITRFWVIIVILAIAGTLAQKNISAINNNALSTHSILFLFFLLGAILIIGPLTYIPAVTLGPISEYFDWVSIK